METTRRYPRTTQEAFKDECYAYAVKGPYKKQSWLFVYVACVISILFLIGLLIAEHAK